MRLIRLFLISAILAVFIWAGCASPRVIQAPGEMPDAFPNHSIDEISQFLNQGADTLNSYRAQARLSFESPQENGRFSADIRHRRSDSLYFGLSPGLGIEAARALITPDSFFVYERINRRLTYGALSDAGEHLPSPIVQGDVFANMLGVIHPDDAVNWELSSDTLHYQLRSPDGKETYVIDPQYWRVVKYELRSEDGRLLEERRFSDFVLRENLALARQVDMHQPQQNARARITYREVEINPTNLSFDIQADPVRERVNVSSR